MQKTILPSTFLVVVFCVFTFLASAARAEIKVVKQSFDSAPHQVVQDTTVNVLAAIDKGPDPAKEPEKFVEQLSLVLDPVIAFNHIAKGVMGKYAKQVSKEQVQQFAKAFKLGLVNTYGQGMSNFGDYEIAVQAPAEPLGEKRRATVIQEIRGGGSAPVLVSYTMGKNKKGEWKMINMVLNGLNLGQTFRSQFAAEVEKNKGDVTKTINEWGKS